MNRVPAMIIRPLDLVTAVLLLAPDVPADPGPGAARTAGLGLNPARIEVEILPGGEKTVGFRIESPPSDAPVQGRLMLSLTDWNIDEQANVSYLDPGSLPDSACPWIVFSPAAVNISSGESQLVRITVRVPESARPGVYRSGILVQERPPATPPKPGEHVLYFRFRYAFTLYVIVPPVAGRGELLDVRLEEGAGGVALVCRMQNTGSRHVRPRISWSIRDGEQQPVAVLKNKESTVLLPFSTVTVRFPVAGSLPPGRYEIDAQVDFNDGGSLQAARRAVLLAADGARAAAAGTVKPR